jgi:hypothetical protein
MTTKDTFGARCVDSLCGRISANWFAPRSIISLIEEWRDALEAAFEAVAEHDPDRVISIPARPDSDTAVCVLGNWDDFLGRSVVWDVLEDKVAETQGAQASQLTAAVALSAQLRADEKDVRADEYRVTVTVTVRAEDEDSSLNAAQDAVALAAWQLSELSPFETVAVEHVRAEVLS